MKKLILFLLCTYTINVKPSLKNIDIDTIMTSFFALTAITSIVGAIYLWPKEELEDNSKRINQLLEYQNALQLLRREYGPNH